MTKDIIGYDGLYKISDDGVVYSLRGINGIRVVKPVCRNNYPGVVLIKNGVRKRYDIHRLVAIYFIDNPLNKREVNHINGIKSDNRVENLEWVTSSENKLHNYRKLNKKRAGIPVTISNKHYPSITHAERSTGISFYLIKKNL